jgi:hypothetical protein
MDKEKCEVEGCERSKEFWFTKYCAAHAMRVRRKGKPGPAAIRSYRRRPERPS